MIGAWRWIATMAWRDSRPSRKRLLLFSAPLIFGVAALVAVQSLRDNVRDAIDEQSRALLGADLFLAANHPWDEKGQALRQRIGGEQVEEIHFQTMAYFPKADASRLVTIRAVQRGFPFYGEILTTPANAWTKGLARGEVALEKALLTQFGLEVGDRCKLGQREFIIAARIENTPPRAGYSSLFAPQVMMNHADAATTGLLTKRSLSNHRVYFKLPAQNGAELAKTLEQEIRELRMNSSTPESMRRSLGQHLDRLYRFLSLIGLASVILGGIGISSAIHQHISRRLPSVAMLRCLGCPMGHAFGVYALQAVTLGFVGYIGGCLLGVGVQAAAPLALAKVLPFTISFQLSWPALLLSMGLSVAICAGFGILPVLKVRRIPPLAAIRASLLGGGADRRDPLVWAVFGGMALVLFAFSYWQHSERGFGLYYAGGLLAVFAILAGVSKLLVYLSRKIARPSWPFELRQGIAHLHRPQNQTTSFLLSVGLGVFLIVLLLLIQGLLLRQLDQERLADRGNLMLLDVQPDQREGVVDTLKTFGMEAKQQSPVVLMRLASVKGKPISELIKDKNSKIPSWVFRWEFRSTYRPDLDPKTEQLLRGQWMARAEGYRPGDVAPVSLEEGMAKDLGVDVGDLLALDVQGIELPAKVVNIRKVDWNRLGLNFYMVFPEGILEEALGFYLLTTYAADAATVGKMQTALVKSHPNVSVLDLSSLFDLLESIVDKVAVAIRLMASFTVATGILILIATLISSRSARLREVALLRTLGASNRQVRWVLSTEYLLLGAISAVSGAALAVACLIPLAKRVFEAPFAWSLPPVLVVVLGAAGLTWALGMLFSRGLSNSPPLEVLREQGLG